MEAVMIPANTVVYIGGVPVTLVVDTLVETAYDNMKLLKGYHYAHIPDVPDSSLAATERGFLEASTLDRIDAALAGGPNHDPHITVDDALWLRARIAAASRDSQKDAR